MQMQKGRQGNRRQHVLPAISKRLFLRWPVAGIQDMERRKQVKNNQKKGQSPSLVVDHLSGITLFKIV
jgi:hypothetical protein